LPRIWLASLRAPATANGTADGGKRGTADYDAAVGDALDLGSGMSVSGTISTLWRGGNDNFEKPNYFADTWVRLDWQSEDALHARVTACTSCHSDQSNRRKLCTGARGSHGSLRFVAGLREKDRRSEYCRTKVKAEIKAGRFVVPFGAFQAMNHPAIYRTVANALMFNMAGQVDPDSRRPAVLPRPYSGEGVDLHTMIPLGQQWKITLDGFAVKCLQGGGSDVNFTRSRSYTDNHLDAGYRGRATISNKKVRIGGSLMAGRLQEQGSGPLNYHPTGAEATARFWDDDV